MDTIQAKIVNRPTATPQPAASAKLVQRKAVTTTVPLQIQTATKVSSPNDPAEKEADTTAKQIMRMSIPEGSITPVKTESGTVFRQVKQDEKEKQVQRQLRSPYINRFADSGVFTRRDETLQRKAEGQPNVASSVAADLQNSMASGSPLPPSVRRFMEPRFRANFSTVKVHTGDRAAKLNRQLNAQAFAMGNHIFFGKDQFKPDTQDGKELIAHELTHTIQQGVVAQPGPAIQRSADLNITQQSPPQVQRLGISDALDYFADKANIIPGFRMFTIILGVNPINMSRVERSAANILRAIVEFLPGGGLIVQALDNYGVFDRVGNWIEQQIRSLGMTGSIIREAINQFLDSLSWTDIFDLGGVWNRAKRIFTEPIDRIINFGKGLVTGIIQLIKDAILRPLARLAEGTRGYDLLKAVLGFDPITGDPVPRNADTLIGGFMKLIGQEEVWNNLKRANAVARAWAWFQGALSGLLGFVRQIPGLFVQALRSLEIADIVLLPRAFARVGSVFAGFLGQFFSWAGQQVISLLQIIFEVVAPGAMPYIRRAAGAFRSIIQNPVGFVGNLVRAGIRGFRQFAGNFLAHLRASLIGWLTGTMSGANLYIPQAFTLREIIKFVMSVLGLTWQNIRQKLVRAVGETAVRVLETGFDLVMTLVTQGPAAAWEKIQESLSNLREMVMEQIMTFVRDRIVQAAITRLLTSLNPAGAFIQAIIATYNTIMFFVERLRQIAQVAMSLIDSISAIAGGVLGTAANRVEQTMAGLLTLVISFLARIAGLGRVSDAVTNIINRVRAPIDRALDRVVDWIVNTARRLGSFFRGQDARSPAEKQRDLDRAVRELRPLMQPMLERGTHRLILRGRMLIWKRQYRLTDLSIDGRQIRATINPTASMFSTEEIALGRMLEPILQEAERLHLLAVARNRTSGQRLDRATTAARSGRPLPSGMTQDEMVILLRRQGLLARSRVLNRDGVAVELANRRRRVWGIGSYVPTHLPGMQDTRSRFGRGRRWFGSVNRALEEKAGETPVSRTLRDEVEVARHLGNLPAARIGSALVASATMEQPIPVVADVAVPGATNLVSPSEITFGRMAPMATDSSAGASSTEENIDAATPQGLRAATEVRQGSYAVIFNTLSAAIRQSRDPILKLPGRQGEALQAIVQAFDQWKAIVTRNPRAASSAAAMQAAQRLQNAITRFLAATRGG